MEKSMTKKNGEATKTVDESLDEAALKLARETLTGDIRDVILNDMKERKTSLPWNMRNEAQQEEIISQIARLAESVVSRTVRIVAAGGRKTISASLDKITIKDGIKAEIALSKYDEQRHLLTDSVGSSVQIVIADPEIYQGERSPVFASPDQSSILDHDPDTGEVKNDGDIPSFLDKRKKKNDGDEAGASA
jgi:hypothetical protein